MSQNLLPFEYKELFRFGYSVNTIKFLLLRVAQSYTFSKANAIVFLSSYAKQIISKKVCLSEKNSAVIPHGVNKRFFSRPRTQKSIYAYNYSNPFKIIYVSVIHVYKHQWNVVEAISILRSKGFPLTLELIGSPASGIQLLNESINKFDPFFDFVDFCGEVPYDQIHSRYMKADMVVFASTCENLPNILIEAMASGMPIASSNYGPMPDVLAEAGQYFDPENSKNIAEVIEKLILSESLRKICAEQSFKRAAEFSWEKCSDMTFKYLADIHFN